jgi:hypothetical protein
MSVIRQLAQAVLVLGMLAWVACLLLTAVRDHYRRPKS